MREGSGRGLQRNDHDLCSLYKDHSLPAYMDMQRSQECAYIRRIATTARNVMKCLATLFGKRGKERMAREKKFVLEHDGRMPLRQHYRMDSCSIRELDIHCIEGRPNGFRYIWKLRIVGIHLITQSHLERLVAKIYLLALWFRNVQDFQFLLTWNIIQ